MVKAARRFKRSKNKQREKDVQEKVALMSNMPDNCLSCHKVFDKADKEQVFSWRVVVREQEKKVNLYCPDCWDRAINIVQEMEKEMGERGV